MNDRDAVAPLLSRRVTVQFHILLCELVSLEITFGARVMEPSDPTVTAEFQFVSPWFQVALPLSAPDQLKRTWFTLRKLVPVSWSIAQWVELLVTIVDGLRPVKASVGTGGVGGL